MKTNVLGPLKRGTAIVKSPGRAVKTNHFIEINKDVDHLWQMYQAQLQRNGELMAIIDRQQQFIQQVINKGVMNTFMPEPAQLPQEPVTLAIQLPEFRDLNVDKLDQYTEHFKTLFGLEVKRLDGIHSIIKLIYILHQMGGIAFPEQLFKKSNIAKSTGFRNSMFLKRKYLIMTVGGKYDTRYKITDLGRQFLDCSLKTGYDKLMKEDPASEQSKKAWDHLIKLQAEEYHT